MSRQLMVRPPISVAEFKRMRRPPGRPPERPASALSYAFCRADFYTLVNRTTGKPPFRTHGRVGLQQLLAVLRVWRVAARAKWDVIGWYDDNDTRVCASFRLDGRTFYCDHTT